MKQKSIKLLFVVQWNKRPAPVRHITLLMGAPERDRLSVYSFLSEKEFPCFSVAHCQTRLDSSIVMNSQSIVYKCRGIAMEILLFLTNVDWKPEADAFCSPLSQDLISVMEMAVFKYRCCSVYTQQAPSVAAHIICSTDQTLCSQLAAVMWIASGFQKQQHFKSLSLSRF
jgi:hypothetical protein